jgi:hypothetical protein
VAHEPTPEAPQLFCFFGWKYSTATNWMIHPVYLVTNGPGTGEGTDFWFFLKGSQRPGYPGEKRELCPWQDFNEFRVQVDEHGDSPQIINPPITDRSWPTQAGKDAWSSGVRDYHIVQSQLCFNWFRPPQGFPAPILYELCCSNNRYPTIDPFQNPEFAPAPECHPADKLRNEWPRRIAIVESVSLQGPRYNLGTFSADATSHDFGLAPFSHAITVYEERVNGPLLGVFTAASFFPRTLNPEWTHVGNHYVVTDAGVLCFWKPFPVVGFAAPGSVFNTAVLPPERPEPLVENRAQGAVTPQQDRVCCTEWPPSNAIDYEPAEGCKGSLLY